MGSDGLSDWGLIAEVFAGKGEVGEGGQMEGRLRLRLCGADDEGNGILPAAEGFWASR